MVKKHKIRNHTGNEGIAENRYEIYKHAMSRYKLAFEQGFYFEAVAIMESVIADRMESRIGELTNTEVNFDTLSNLRDKLNGKKDKYPTIEPNQELQKLYNKIVSDWAGKRNKALHQIVKISIKEPKDWQTTLTKAKEAAEEGKKYFKELDKILKRERKSKNV